MAQEDFCVLYNSWSHFKYCLHINGNDHFLTWINNQNAEQNQVEYFSICLYNIIQLTKNVNCCTAITGVALQGILHT